MQIRVTDKFRKSLGIKPGELHEVKDDDSPMGCWYGNLFFSDGKKALFFVNENSLFTFILAGFTRRKLDNLPELFKCGLAQALEVNGFSASEVEYLTQGTEVVVFTKTANRSVIGSMNDLQSLFMSFHDKADAEFKHVLQKINRVPHIKRKHAYAVDAVREMAAQR